MQLDYYVHICSDKKRDRCGMYPKKTLSAASLLSKCERKRCRSLEARGCAKSESEFSMGTVLTHPFLCLNRYKQNDRTTYIICYHSAPYSFTSKPEKGGEGADETWHCQPLHKRIVQTTLLIIAEIKLMRIALQVNITV